MDLTNQDPSQRPASEKGRFGDATRSNQEPRQVHGDEAGPRSGHEVNPQVEVQINRVHGQAWAWL